MLPPEVVRSLLGVGDVIGLQLMTGNGGQVATFPVRVQAYEYPNNLWEFSLGTASALATAGTGWSNIQDSANRYLLQPPTTGQLFQFWYGITPSFARVYRAFEPNSPRGGLVVPITVGGTVGYVTGADSPYKSPSPLTETFSIFAMTPAYNGYHPFATPASISIFMNFYIARYMVEPAVGVIPKRIVTMGGVPPPIAPQWLSGSQSALR